MVIAATRNGGVRRPTGGFTLAELMITIALIGILFGVMFLKLDTLVPTQRLGAAARSIASHLDLARNAAVLSGKTVKVQYDLDARAYRAYFPYLFHDDGRTILSEGETDIVDWTELPDTVIFRQIVLSQESAKSGVVTVTFEPRGIASQHVVHLGREHEDDPEAAYSVVLNPLVGYVDIVEGTFTFEVLEQIGGF